MQGFLQLLTVIKESECNIEEIDAVYLKVEIRSRAELRLMEVAVRNDLGVTGVCSIGIDISFIGRERFAANWHNG